MLAGLLDRRGVMLLSVSYYQANGERRTHSIRSAGQPTRTYTRTHTRAIFDSMASRAAAASCCGGAARLSLSRARACCFVPVFRPKNAKKRFARRHFHLRPAGRKEAKGFGVAALARLLAAAGWMPRKASQRRSQARPRRGQSRREAAASIIMMMHACSSGALTHARERGAGWTWTQGRRARSRCSSQGSTTSKGVGWSCCGRAAGVESGRKSKQPHAPFLALGPSAASYQWASARKGHLEGADGGTIVDGSMTLIHTHTCTHTCTQARQPGGPDARR